MHDFSLQWSIFSGLLRPEGSGMFNFSYPALCRFSLSVNPTAPHFGLVPSPGLPFSANAAETTTRAGWMDVADGERDRNILQPLRLSAWAKKRRKKKFKR